MATRRRGKKNLAPRQRAPRLDPMVKKSRWCWRGVIALVGVVVLVLISYRFGRAWIPSTSLTAIDVQSGAAAGFNVALLTVDTLRADHVHCYGYDGVLTPALDALAIGGVRVADAVSVVPMTLPAHATIMTGEYPPEHGVRDNGTYRLAAQSETLAERLKAEGYSTAAFIAAFVLDKRYGLNQGFDVYDDEITPEQCVSGGESLNPQRPANVVVDAAVRWLEEYQRSRI